ncbi:MAG: PQQ-dependent sugar dehydrogenase [bacterium]|nr:PQQ-dependent sugar dehydrogenase [Candidatus Kapabacteria bacterium]
MRFTFREKTMLFMRKVDRSFVVLAAFVACHAIGSCDSAPQGRASGTVATNDSVALRVETFVGGLEVPWSIVFTSAQRMLVAERPGRIRVVESGTLRAEPLLVVNDVELSSETGLMGLTLDPSYESSHQIYLSYAYASGSNIRVRVVRYRDDVTTVSDRTVTIEDLPAARFHAGCRIGFGPDGKLYITTGDATEPGSAQDLGTLAGKTLRLNSDGTIPNDNPFVSRPGARGEIWSYGHRNAQGLDWQPGTGLMFQTEHGPSGNDAPGGGDEVNIVDRGLNYGWPIVHHRESRAGMVPPLAEYTPAVAPASGAFYRGTTFPSFTNNFFFGCLRGEALIRLVLDGRKLIRQERLLDGEYGRIRAVTEGPDGALYVATSNRDGRGSPAQNDDRILRIVPAR